jgi:hypothetical protein
MEALASYARQSEDECLLRFAIRIKARATDRAGEIIRAMSAAANQRQVASGAPLPPGDSRQRAKLGCSVRPRINARCL